MNRQTIIVDTETTNSGQTNANVWVREGGSLTQGGQLNGDATVDQGGVLYQHGQVNGDVHGHGKVTLWGQVNGAIYAHPGSDVQIAEGVMVGKRYVAADGTFQEVPAQGTFMTRVGRTMWRLHPDGTLSRA